MKSDPLSPLQTGLLLSIQAGRVQRMEMPDGPTRDGRNAVWNSGIFKSLVTGSVTVTPDGIAGDEQYDLVNHGGSDNVVLAYDAAHYPGWRSTLSLPQMEHGWFGENFTVSGFSDEGVCIGDVWQVGPELQLQVTQARQPCFKLARRLQRIEIVKLVRESGHGGWYLRVLNPGPAEAGMTISLLRRLHPQWPVARAVQVMYARKRDRASAEALSKLPELSTRWKTELLEIE